nr:amidohydrolase family protein [Candidatus Njordarchaeum guaymaensis]
MIVDAHHHWLISRDELIRRAKGKPSLTPNVLKYLVSALPPKIKCDKERVKLYIEAMNREHIDKLVLFSLDCAGCYDDIVMRVVQELPDRFVGLATVDPLEKGAPDRLEEEIKDYGFKGLKLYALIGPYEDKRYYPLYERAEKLGVPILFHTGNTYLFPPVLAKWTHPIQLDAIGVDFPKLKMIAAHLGYPHWDEMLGVVFRNNNVYVDISGGGYVGVLRWINEWKQSGLSSFEEVGLLPDYLSSKILFATDLLSIAPITPLISEPPHRHWTRYIEFVRKLNLTDSSKEMILGRNAETLFKIKKQ